jgi:hypothetical protein
VVGPALQEAAIKHRAGREPDDDLTLLVVRYCKEKPAADDPSVPARETAVS